MTKKVSDLTKVIEEKREQKGWSLEEIRKKAALNFKKYKKISEENKEPDGFHSGDMNKFLAGHDDNEK